MTNISCVIIAKDAEQTIKSVLDSLTQFADIVLYLNNSSDNTEKTLEKFDYKIVQDKL